jgi:hypothetical protein
VAEYGSPNAQTVTSKPPEHPLLARPARDLPADKSLNYMDLHQRSELRDKKITTEPYSVSMTGSSPDEDQHINNSEFIKVEHRNTLPLGSVNVSVIVPCDRTSQHLPRIAEEKDSPTGSKDEATLMKSLVKEASASPGTSVAKDQESNVFSFGSVKNAESSLKNSRLESKCDLQTQKGKTTDFKANKIAEEKSIPSTKSDTKPRRKENNDSSCNKTEGKGSKAAIPEKDVKPKVADQASSSRSDMVKSSAQEKRELYRVGSSKD